MSSSSQEERQSDDLMENQMPMRISNMVIIMRMGLIQVQMLKKKLDLINLVRVSSGVDLTSPFDEVPNELCFCLDKCSVVETNANTEKTTHEKCLLVALEIGYPAILIRVLSSQDPNMNRKTTRDICTRALFKAAGKGDWEVAQLLLMHKADPGQPNCKGKTAVHVALENEHLALAKSFMQQLTQSKEYVIKRLLSLHSTDGYCIFLTAVKNCPSKEFLSFLLKKGANINSQDNSGQTAIIISLQKHDLGTVKFLLERGANTQLKTQSGLTAKDVAKRENLGKVFDFLLPDPTCTMTNMEILSLMRAIKEGDIDSLRLLLEICNKHQIICHWPLINYALQYTDEHFKKNPTCTKDILSLLLHFGVKVQDFFLLTVIEKNHISVEIIDMLLESGVPIDFDNYKGDTPLILAAQNDNVEVVKHLINKGANLMHRNRNSLTPLLAALKQSSLRAAKVLISNYKNVNIDECLRACYNQNPALYNQEAAKVVLESTKSCYLAPDLLIPFVKTDSLKIVRLLIEHKIDVAKAVEVENILLFVESKEMIDLLFENGAEFKKSLPGSEMSLDLTLHEAFNKEGSYEIIKAFISHGADINARDIHRNTPLMTAIRRSNTDAALYLISSGADVNASNFRHMTPLRMAIKKVDLFTGMSLVQAGAIVNSTALDNQVGLHSPLVFAVKMNYKSFVLLLIEEGADLNFEDHLGRTALSYAYYPHIVCLLVEAGADVNHHTRAGGETPLMFRLHKPDVLRALISHGANVHAITHKSNITGKRYSALSYAMNYLQRYVKMSPQCLQILLKAGAPQMLQPFKCATPLLKFILLNNRNLVKNWVQNGGAPTEICVNCMISDDGSGCCSPKYRNFFFDGIKTLSPLVAALVLRRIRIATYFMENWFLTWSDLNLPCYLKSSTFLLEYFYSEAYEFINKYFSEPPSLQKLSFVAVNAFLKWNPNRETNAKATGLPPVLIKRLLFKTEMKEMQKFYEQLFIPSITCFDTYFDIVGGVDYSDDSLQPEWAHDTGDECSDGISLPSD